MKLLPQHIAKVRTDRKLDSDSDADLTEIPYHIFETQSVNAVNGALAAGRPLLVTGEPGVGKSQLALAVAAALKQPLVPFTVNSRTESTDLLWKMDAIRRLAEAQLCATLSTAGNADEIRSRMDESAFVDPGPLWWGFDWNNAKKHVQTCLQIRGKEIPDDQVAIPDSGGNPADGVVVLIDEIDKAESDVPNGLLEAFGNRSFTPLGCEQVKVTAERPMPLVIITTNRERVLPDAFIRRCLVLELTFPSKDEIIKRGVARFGEQHQSLLEKAATQLLADRKQHSTPPLPGLAEYLDLIRAVLELAKRQERDPESIVDELAAFTFRKQAGGQK
ncbi:MAG: AAA family ATPase [Planctomycetota bacterium]